jgi:hypothetical protein
MGIEVDWEFFRDQLPENWRAIATELGLIRELPPQLHAKVKDIEPVLRLILHRAGLETSLKTTAGEAAAAELIDLSSVALHKWERKLGPYLARLSMPLFDAPTSFGTGRWAGYDVFVTDGTAITRPGAQGVTARVHYVLRLSTLTFVRCVVTDEHGGESLRFHEAVVAPGQLWLGDRFYCNPPGVALLTRKGAAVIVRYNRGSMPLYDEQGEPFDVLAHLRTLKKPGEICEWHVQAHSEQVSGISGRLCAVRLPEDKAEEARERLREEHGRKVSAETLEAAAWLVVFTTVPRSRMKARRVLELYRLRWQVELEVKRDKSIGGLGNLPNRRPDTIATWLQAKLLIQLVAKKLAAGAAAFSPSVAHWRLRAIDERTGLHPRSNGQPARRGRVMARHEPRVRRDPRRAGTPPAA